MTLGSIIFGVPCTRPNLTAKNTIQKQKRVWDKRENPTDRTRKRIVTACALVFSLHPYTFFCFNGDLWLEEYLNWLKNIPWYIFAYIDENKLGQFHLDTSDLRYPSWMMYKAKFLPKRFYASLDGLGAFLNSLGPFLGLPNGNRAHLLQLKVLCCRHVFCFDGENWIAIGCCEKIKTT